MATKPDLIKVSIFLTRKETVSEAEFQAYWTQRHAKVVSEWLQRHGVVRYSQFHTPSWSQQKAKESTTVIPNSHYASYDGVVEILVPHEKCFQNARDDPYYENVVKADEAEFIDVSKSLVLFGWEEVYIEERKLLCQ